MIPQATAPHYSTAKRVSVLFAALLISGCASTPDLSWKAPSTWPGVKQVRGTGSAVGGWVAEKARLKRNKQQADAEQIARRNAPRAELAGDTNSRLRSIFAPEDAPPVDPFLAQTVAENSRVESASHSSDIPRNDVADADPGNRSNFRPAAHSLTNPARPKVDRLPLPDTDEFPFADVAGSENARHPRATPPKSESNPFAGGIDSQLAQLRDDANTGRATIQPPLENSRIRDAIFGPADDETGTLPLEPGDLAADFPLPVRGNDIADVVEDAVDRAVVNTDNVADDSLPAWARDSSSGTARVAALPVEEAPAVEDLPFEPVEEVPTSPFVPAEETEPVRVAVNTRPEPPTAIEIRPFGSYDTHRGPEELSTDDVDPSDRVELLPPPAAEIEAAAVDAIDNNSTPFVAVEEDFDDMIVASDALPSGFAEWQDGNSTATVRTNQPLHATGINSKTGRGIPARLAVNSRATGDDSESAASVVEPRRLRDMTAGSGDNNHAASSAAAPHAHAHNQLVEESALDSVDWDAEAEPAADGGGLSFQSTALIGLLIGLACLVGLTFIRRLHAAA